MNQTQPPTKYRLQDIERIFGLPVRKQTYLIRQNHLKPELRNNILLIAEDEILRYLGLPEHIRRKHHVSYLKTLGPGVITGASDDDPSGIGTYSSAGATYGLRLNWLALYLLPMMTAVQETVARIGIVTGKGLSEVLGKHYGKKILYPLVVFLLFANTVNIGADIGVMVASLQLLWPVSFYVGAIALTASMILLEIFVPYHRYAKFLKFLTLSLVAYIITGFIIKPDWAAVAGSLVIPKIDFNAGFVMMMVGVMGTTISPYLFFWQASEEIEEEQDKGISLINSEHRQFAVKREIKEMRKDTIMGMSFANIIFLFIVITTASVLHKNGITNIESAAQAAQALRPLAGDTAYLLFAAGIFGVGLLAVPVLAGSSAYGLAELFRWHEGLNKRYSQAKGFYGIIIFSMIIGLALNFLNINPIKALVYAAVVNGTISPILMFFIFKIGRDPKVMGENVSPKWVNIWGFIGTFLMGASALLLILLSIFQK